MMHRTLQALPSYLFLLIGVICLLFPARVTAALPYLLGGAMALAGLAGILSGARGGDGGSHALAQGAVLLLLGTAFLLQGERSLAPMGTTWAVIGIRKASQSLERAIRQRRARERFAAPLLAFFLRITLALLLLFDPFEKFSAHVAVLGLELIASSLRLSPAALPPGEA